jgi:hypothetical protein
MIKRLIISILMVVFPLVSSAVSLPWSTTYDCPEWTGPNSLSCDGISYGGGYTCKDDDNTEHHEQITSSANYPGGGGGRGQVHWLGKGSDNNSGTTLLYFSALSEFWFRAYVKYDPAISWNIASMYQKMFYFQGGDYLIPEPSWQGNDVTMIGTPYANNFSSTAYGWTNLWGDGNWHCIEIHSKPNTAGSAPYNGIIQVWIDNELAVDVSTSQGAPNPTDVILGSNISGMQNTTCKPVYIDDVAISATGRIGPIDAGPDETPPTLSNLQPSGNATYGTTKSLTLATNESANCRYHATSTTWAEMSAMSTTGGTSHAQTVNVSVGANSFKAVCQDGSENESDAGTWSFTVAAQAASSKTISTGGSQTITPGAGTLTLILQ